MITVKANIEIIPANDEAITRVDASSFNFSMEGNTTIVVGWEKSVMQNQKLISQFISGLDNSIASNTKRRIDIYSDNGGLSNLTIVFDVIKNVYPIDINVDGVWYKNNSPLFSVKNLDTSLTKHNISFGIYLNKPKSRLIIERVCTGAEININNINLVSLSTNHIDRSDYSLPSYGIISNTGEIEFKDITRQVVYYSEGGLLTSDIPVSIKLVNTDNDQEENIAIMETNDWNYDNYSRVVNVSLRDDLEEWQDIQVEGFSYNPKFPFGIWANGSMADVYRWLVEEERTPTKYNMLAFEELDSETRTILSNTKINYPLLNNGTLWQQWNKLCKVCGLYIYKDNNGRTVCRYTLGS